LHNIVAPLPYLFKYKLKELRKMDKNKLVLILEELSLENNNKYSEKVIEYIQVKGVVSFFKLLYIAEILIKKNINIEKVNTKDIEILLGDYENG